MIRPATTLLCLFLSGCTYKHALTKSVLNYTTNMNTLATAYDDAHAGWFQGLRGLDEYGGLDMYKLAIKSRAMEVGDFTPEEKTAINRGDIIRGMTWDALWFSWGPPVHTERSESPLGTTEHWNFGYRDHGDGRGRRPTHVTLHDGAVTWWSIE